VPVIVLVGVSLLLVLSGLTGGSSLGNPAALKLVFPLVCALNSDCFFANYIDHHTGPGLQDYQCGRITYDGHRGTDITLPNFRLMDRGVYVLAAADGVVIEAQDGRFDRNKGRNPGGFGNYITIEHEGGVRTIYAHLKKGSLKVRVGQGVSQGEEIAEVGSSGNSTDAHLHFEVQDHAGRIIEPFRGPCGSPTSLWEEQPAYEDEFQVLDYGMTNFEPTINQLKERPATQADFTTEDPLFLFWVQVKSVKPGDVARVEFYKPNGQLFRRSEFRHNRYYRYSWWYWFWLREAWAGMPKGRWTVKYFLNGRLYVTMPFRVSSPSAPAPEIWLAEERLDFGRVKLGKTREYRLIIENIGDANLQISIESSDRAFRVEPTSAAVAPGQKLLIPVIFEPKEPGMHQGKLIFTTNDPDEGSLTVSVEGIGME